MNFSYQKLPIQLAVVAAALTLPTIAYSAGVRTSPAMFSARDAGQLINIAATPLDDALLNDIRGGIDLGGNLQISIGLMRTVAVNGIERYASVLHIDSATLAALAPLKTLSAVTAVTPLAPIKTLDPLAALDALEPFSTLQPMKEAPLGTAQIGAQLTGTSQTGTPRIVLQQPGASSAITGIPLEDMPSAPSVTVLGVTDQALTPVIIQNGGGNSFDTSELQQLGGAAVPVIIQNTLDNQSILSSNLLDVTISNVASKAAGVSASRAISESLVMHR